MLQEGDGFVPELKNTLALVTDAEDHRFAQFQKEIFSRKKMMKVKDRSCAEFQNEMNSIKLLIKVQGERHDQFQNAMDSVKNTMKMENKCHSKYLDEMNSMTMTIERTPSMPMKQDGTPSNIQAAPPPRRDEGTQENLPCSFHVYSQENKISDQQGTAGSCAAPKCQGSESLVRYWKQHDAQACGGHVKVYICRPTSST
jgi:hypothetical protein